MAQSPEISVQSASWDFENGVCAQDFETNLQSYVSPAHLKGLLNFSALWNRVTYIYDTAIGDNPHLINSYLLPPPDNVLYDTFIEFIREGIIQCLIRDKITIGGVDFGKDPRDCLSRHPP